MSKYVVLNPGDGVGVAVEALVRGEPIDAVSGLVLREDVPAGHKFSIRDIARGDMVEKYGTPIGHATVDIPAGSWVHVHNVATNLSGEIDYVYEPARDDGSRPPVDMPTFMGYRRASGKTGIRNEVWIVPTVSCVNWLAERLAGAGREMKPEGVDEVVAFTHPLGCSQLGEDHENTRTILANLSRHPNVAGVLYVGLGCENNVMADFIRLVESSEDRCRNIRYMIAQDEDDEWEAGLGRLRAVIAEAARAERTEAPVSEICVGMKCGASDGLSGVTANPLLGAFSDWLVDRGGRTILTEVPEMFGAEKALLNRAADEAVFERGVAMINDFKRYFLRYDQVIYENPSPGNKEGGITTLEDKSIGCTQKGGARPVVDVLPYGGMAAKPGVTLLYGPGNDMVSVSAMAAAGAHLVLFSTGRGNPLGGPAPVVKVASNSGLASRKSHWIDFDASPLADGRPMPELLGEFVALFLEVVSGRKTRSEIAGYRDFAIFKDGVTL